MPFDAIQPAEAGTQDTPRRSQGPHQLRDILPELLARIIADPEAGAWSECAHKLLAGDDPIHVGEHPSQVDGVPGTDDAEWQPPRKPR